MIWLPILACIVLAAIGSALWLVVFNLVLLMFSQLGFCENAAQLAEANPDCPPPVWYWIGCAIVPALLAVAAMRKAAALWKDHQADI